MKKILFFALISFGLFSCSNDDVGADNSLSEVAGLKAYSLQKGNSNSSSAYSDYNIDVAVSADGSEWTYTITKTKTTSKNLSHFIVDLGNCGEQSATFADIISAKVNGDDADLKPTEGSGTQCNPQSSTTNFVKVNFAPATVLELVIKFDRGYEITDADSWLKAGTSCNSGKTKAPGCPKEDYCSYSQGYFFANGAMNNGSSILWEGGLNIGGKSYTQTQGMDAWNIDQGRGGNQTLNAFFQLGAIRLSLAEAAVQENANIIDSYFAAIENIFNYKTTITPTRGNSPPYDTFIFPTSGGGYSESEVTAAGSAIGHYIVEHRCQ